MNFTRVPGNVNLLMFHFITTWKITGIIPFKSYLLNIDTLDNRHPHGPTVDMTPPSSWFDSNMAYTADEMYAGDGCHPDEAQALSDYLRGNLTEAEAAKRIIAATVNETSPSQETYRLWVLLSEALVELSDRNQQKTLDLIAQIQALSPASDIQRAHLPAFASMWYDLNKAHMHGVCGIGIFDPEHQDEFRRMYEAAGRAEGAMLLRGLDVANEEMGYQVLNQIRFDGPEIEILTSEVFGWLSAAG
jgi:hypothetical protein